MLPVMLAEIRRHGFDFSGNVFDAETAVAGTIRVWDIVQGNRCQNALDLKKRVSVC